MKGYGVVRGSLRPQPLTVDPSRPGAAVPTAPRYRNQARAEPRHPTDQPRRRPWFRQAQPTVRGLNRRRRGSTNDLVVEQRPKGANDETTDP